MKRLVAVLACGSILGIAASATALTIGDSKTLGTIDFGIPTGDEYITQYVDHLRLMGLNSSDAALGQTFYRSGNSFSPLDAPILALRNTYGDGDLAGPGVTVNLGTGGYMYLFAKYDGPNYGSVVWYVNGLTGNVTIPTHGADGQYGLSGTALFNPGTNRTPDAGSTAMLLGIALSGLAMLRRSLS